MTTENMSRDGLATSCLAFPMENKYTEMTQIGRRRLISRCGETNIYFLNLKKKHSRYLRDIYTTLVDLSWGWTLVIFFVSFLLSYMIFGYIWFLIIKTHGDDLSKENRTPCLKNVKTLTEAFLFSIETQSTIGFGSRYPTAECLESVVTLTAQSIVGLILQAFMVGVVFAKLTKPRKRTNTLLFSQVATVCLRDRQLCLTCRVADMRKSSIIGATVKAHVIRRHETTEGEVIPYYQTEIQVKNDNCSANSLFLWPMTIVHVIDSDSPFYYSSASDVMNDDFELVVCLEGVAESTGTSVQARCSYVPSTIHWGHRFQNLLDYSTETESYLVDFRLFNSTSEIPTPLCSAHDLEVYQELREKVLCTSASHPGCFLSVDLGKTKASGAGSKRVRLLNRHKRSSSL